MQIAEFIELLFHLDRKHQDDRDGGYALVDSLVCHLQKLPSEHREQASNVLLIIIGLGSVPRAAERLWGVSLEVVTRMMTVRLAQEILALSEIVGAESRDWFINALLRSSVEYPEPLWASITDQLAKSPPTPNLFHQYVLLYRRCPNAEFMEKIASLFVSVFSLEESEGLWIGRIQSILALWGTACPEAIVDFLKAVRRLSPLHFERASNLVLSEIRKGFYNIDKESALLMAIKNISDA